MPRHILSKASDPNTAPFNGAPIGTGPFKWGARIPGDNLTLVANQRYHGTGPFLEKAVLKYVPDQTALYAQFRTGQVDVVVLPGIAANFYEEAIKLPGHNVTKVPSATRELLIPNLEHPVLSDIV